ncbi:MAG: sigma-70 family RNA polymerase sigma factor [Phycisphaerales bacterium]|nr:sigma-70 family RNA polymerase sigma factor [Phycisphaerae bacterium]NNF41859.1 sigma-70 family RNA polymerase sigma factor [Phycisphaerales bacterium]NNM26233.1 sigma-70 family RNA polymerase sigma factor [Phycisphaerales bacterium]
MPTDAPTLTAAMAAGDRVALAAFYERWFDAMMGEARRLTGGDDDEALDLVHDTMLRAIRSMKPLPSDAAVMRWLQRAIRSCAIDRHRVVMRRRRREAAVAPVSAGAADGPDRTRLAWLEKELRTLGGEDRTLLRLRHQFGWTLAEIGRRVGLEPGAVDGRLRRLAARLRRRAPEVLDE